MVGWFVGWLAGGSVLVVVVVSQVRFAAAHRNFSSVSLSRTPGFPPATYTHLSLPLILSHLLAPTPCAIPNIHKLFQQVKTLLVCLTCLHPHSLSQALTSSHSHFLTHLTPRDTYNQQVMTLLVSLKAAALGLNLTVANHVVLLDLW